MIRSSVTIVDDGTLTIGRGHPGDALRVLGEEVALDPDELRDELELEGLDHAATWNADVRGHPEPVARELRRFFA